MSRKLGKHFKFEALLVGSTVRVGVGAVRSSVAIIWVVGTSPLTEALLNLLLVSSQQSQESVVVSARCKLKEDPVKTKPMYLQYDTRSSETTF